MSIASHAFIPVEFTMCCFIGLLSREDVVFLNLLNREGNPRAGKYLAG